MKFSKPIETAPQDGTIIISNVGTCKWLSNPYYEGWYLCDGDGTIPSCAEYGQDISSVIPTAWYGELNA